MSKLSLGQVSDGFVIDTWMLALQIGGSQISLTSLKFELPHKKGINLFFEDIYSLTLETLIFIHSIQSYGQTAVLKTRDAVARKYIQILLKVYKQELH